jgi:hypothetical protein
MKIGMPGSEEQVLEEPHPFPGDASNFTTLKTQLGGKQLACRSSARNPPGSLSDDKSVRWVNKEVR